MFSTVHPISPLDPTYTLSGQNSTGRVGSGLGSGLWLGSGLGLGLRSLGLRRWGILYVLERPGLRLYIFFNNVFTTVHYVESIGLVGSVGWLRLLVRTAARLTMMMS